MDKTAIRRKTRETIKDFIIIVVYLWVILGLFAIYRDVILNRGASIFEHGIVLINALVLGKVMLIAKELHLGEVAKGRPLIYPTLIRSAMFSVVLAFFKVLEEVARGLFKHESFQQTMADIAGGSWRVILCATGILFVALIPFFAFTELQRVFGETKLWDLFFHSRRAGQAANTEAAKER